MPYLEFRKRLAKSIALHLARPEVLEEDLLTDFSFPPSVTMGHVALPCFRIAKLLRKPPQEIAAQLAKTLAIPAVETAAAGPYLNLKWKASALASLVLESILNQKETYGRDGSGVGRRIVLEYCSPNIAKNLAFHHIRSTLIGNTLANIYEALGYGVERINFVGDWGAQFARLLAAVELWGDAKRLTESDIPGSMAHLAELYVRFHKDLDNHPDRLVNANDCLKRLEAGEKRTQELWKKIRAISTGSMNATLSRMNIRFNHTEGESDYIQAIETVLPDVKEKAQAKISDGAWIVEVEGIPTPALIQKRDGTTLYLTRDIAAAIGRFNQYQFERMLYIVGEQQRLHFQLLFGTLSKMGHDWSKRCEHISYGTVLFGSEKMSTREGRVILLDDVLNEAKALALVECTNKNPALAGKEEVAEMVGIGAILFGELSAHRVRDIEFDWKQILALDGETGPYVQYAAVRCQSLLEKAGIGHKELLSGVGLCHAYSFSVEEETLLLWLSRFRQVLHQIVRENEPFYLTQYLIECAKAFSRFYYRLPVLQAADADQRSLRLSLTASTLQVLHNGLSLLGMSCPKEM